MATYISLPILDELVRFAESDSVYEDAGVGNSQLLLCQLFHGAPEQKRDDKFADFFILRIQRRFPGDRSVVDHTLVEAKRESDSVDASLEQLENALEHANTEFGRCWGLLILGVNFMFYEYHANLPENNCLVPWGPPGQPTQNSYHARNDAMTIDWMLRHMVQNNTPPARQRA